MKNSKVLFFINSLGGGGAERVCVNLANGFYRKGFDISLLVLNLNNDVFSKELDEDIAFYNLNKNHTREAFFKLGRFLLEKDFRVILVFNYQLAVLLLFLRNALFLDYKIIVRNINTLSMIYERQSSFWHKYFVNSLTKVFYKRVDLIVAQSEGMKKDLVLNYYIPSEKIVTINNPVNKKIEEFAKSIDYIKFPKRHEVLFVGSLTEKKGVEYLFRAFALVHREDPDLKLRIVGEGRLKDKLVKLSHDLDIDKNVVFEGFVSDVGIYYLKAKATLLTSLYEGFPNVLVESLTLGTPVVSFDCPSGPSEIIEDGKNGYLVEYLNIEAFKDAVLRVLKRDFDSKSVAMTALKYSNEVILEKYAKVIKSFLWHYR